MIRTFQNLPQPFRRPGRTSLVLQRFYSRAPPPPPLPNPEDDGLNLERSPTKSLRPPPPSHAGDIFQWNSAITAHLRAGRVSAARRLFDEMPERNVFTWNCMISGLIRNRMLADAHKVFDAMQTRNSVSWAALLTGYARCGRVAEARELFDRMPDRNVVSWNAMVSGYVRNGMVERARELFDMMPSRDDVSWLTMISGYIKRNRVREARGLFDRAPSPSTSVCNALLSGYVELGCMKDAEELFDRMQRRDLVSWNVMITGYARAGRMEVAQSLFDEMPEKDTISWTAIMRGYLQNGDVDAAWKVFQDMPDHDVVAWNTMMGGFVLSERLDDALRLFSQMPDRDLVSWNTILQGYVQQGDMDSANTWFRSMPEKNETSWNTLISGYKDEGALALLSEMVRGGLRPDQATLSVIISICASLVALGCGKMVHLCAIKTGFEHDALVMSSLISMYSKCGLIAEASQVFELILRRDTVIWNAMIATYAYHGMAAEALKLFDRMTKDGFSPDHATFLSVLSACAHKGYLYEGCHYFRSMQEDWNLVPRSDHYSCMVDLLGRLGFIHQAYDFSSKIPSDLQINAWETLFSACNAHGDIQLGELIAKNVLQARPSDGGMYTLLSNIYAAKEMWSSAASVRGFMKERGLKKETGCSWIELKGEVVSFSSNDNAHPLIEQICQEVDNISVMIEEFPTAGLQSVPGDGEGGNEMTGSMVFIREFCNSFVPAEKTTRTRISAFKGCSLKLDYLTKPSLFEDYGFTTKVKMADHVRPEDETFFVAYPYFNANEMLVVEELYKEAVVNMDQKLIIFNGELDRIRSGYYPPFFYPKLAELSKAFLPKLETVYYIHNFKGLKRGDTFQVLPWPLEGVEKHRWQLRLFASARGDADIEESGPRHPSYSSKSSV